MQLAAIEGTLITDSQEIRAILDCVGPIDEDPDEITGAVVQAKDGEYTEVWLTGWSNPHLPDTHYRRVL